MIRCLSAASRRRRCACSLLRLRDAFAAQARSVRESRMCHIAQPWAWQAQAESVIVSGSLPTPKRRGSRWWVGRPYSSGALHMHPKQSTVNYSPCCGSSLLRYTGGLDDLVCRDEQSFFSGIPPADFAKPRDRVHWPYEDLVHVLGICHLHLGHAHGDTPGVQLRAVDPDAHMSRVICHNSRGWA